MARLTALCASGAIVVAGQSVAPAASALGTDTPAAERGAVWLTSKLVGDLLISNNPPDIAAFESADASLDASIAFSQVPGHELQGKATLDAVESLIPSYTLEQVGGQQTGGFDGSIRYPGRIGKAASVALRNNKDLGDFGGGELIADLQKRVSNETPIAGRVEDFVDPVDPTSEAGIQFVANHPDQANVVDQAWAAEALKRAAKLPGAVNALDFDANRVTDFLIKQQCPRGWFRAEFSPKNAVAIEQDCDAFRVINGGPDVFSNRTTAQVALILAKLVEDGVVTNNPKISDALELAGQWLADKQNSSGSFRDAALDEPDAYTTGLAGLVLAATGHPTDAREAAEWLRGVQAFDPVECIPNGLTDETGAIAPDKAASKLGKTNGISTEFSWRQSTALALPLLTLAPHTVGPPSISGPTGFIHSGAKLNLRLSRLEVGERACAYGLKLSRLIAAEASTALAPMVAPAGTANRRYTIKSIEGNDSLVLHILDSTKFKVKAKLKSVKRNSKQRVLVSGLAAGERVRVVVKGKTVAKGKANAKGKFKKKFKAKLPRGQAVMKVWGQFGDRNGKTKFKVR